jgi:lipoprotein-releasing system permease protein
MRLPLFIARRYFFSRKFGNVINIITLVAVLGIGVCTAALILVLSVFNGLTDFIEDLFSAMDPDIKIVPAKGQYMDYDSLVVQQLREHPDIAALTRTVEGKIVLEYVDNQAYGTLKGVEEDFVEVNRIDTFVYEGNYDFSARNSIPQAVFGSVVAAKLKANILNEIQPVKVYYIPQESNLSNPSAIKNDFLFPSGFFSVQLEYDEKYIISSLESVQEVLELGQRLSAYEIRLHDIDRAEAIKPQLQALLGPEYEVLTWYEQHQTLYRVMKNEKYISFLILVLMLTVAAINIVGSLSMIVIEKTRDISVLKSFGAEKRLIRQIFLTEGMLVGGAGAFFGVVIALTLGLLQEYYGLLTLEGGESFRVKAFPITLQLNDFLLVIATVILLSILAALYPARQASQVMVVEGLRK